MNPHRTTLCLAPLLLALSVGTAFAEPPPPRVQFVEPAKLQPQTQQKTTIFFDDFTDAANLAGRYFEYTDAKESFLRDPTGGLNGSPAMKQQWTKGQVSGGGLKVLFGKSPFRNKGIRTDETFREIYWRIYVKHEDGWQGAPAKLARATCLASADWTQGLIAHVWTGKTEPVLVLDPATGIVDSKKVSVKYNDFDHLKWLGMLKSKTPIFTSDESGRWVCIESHVKLNTPGKKDGVFELSVDARPEAGRHDLDWHGTWQEYGINAVFFENYWNDGAVKDEARWFDNIVVATAPIGPIVAADPPVLHLKGHQGVNVQVVADEAGKDVVWVSGGLDANVTVLTVDARHGTFAGSRDGKTSLESGRVYWIRLRPRDKETPWGPVHAAFTAP